LQADRRLFCNVPSLNLGFHFFDDLHANCLFVVHIGSTEAKRDISCLQKLEPRPTAKLTARETTDFSLGFNRLRPQSRRNAGAIPNEQPERRSLWFGFGPYCQAALALFLLPGGLPRRLGASLRFN
jgi:hypothetical protein